MNEKIEVFAQINEDGFITAVNSSIFLKDTTGWIKIDEGFGDRFAHAQTLYFDKPLSDELGNYTIKYGK